MPQSSSLLQKFVDNTTDLTKRYGLKAASFGFAVGSALLSQKFFQGADPLLWRNIVAPVFLVGGSVAGFLGFERTNNTLSMIGSAFMAVSFAGADGDGFAPVLCALNAAGVVTMGLGSHLVPSKKKQQEDAGEIKNVAYDGKTQTAGFQVIGNIALLMSAIASNKADVILPYTLWVTSSVLKAARASFVAADKIDAYKKGLDL